jgi:eukaryotic-like serine/threonine-protein kinase
MLAGDLVDARFEIEALAGSGGMGDVYRALDRTTGEVVAVKVLHVAGPHELTRFLRETKALAAVRLPGVVRYVAHGATAAGNPYLAMDWLTGETLADRLVRRGLTTAETVALGARIAATLGEIHARGIVHRDVKPSNLVLVDGDLSRVMLLDFGIARVLGDQQLTMPGTILGTPAYMAPEQARGESTVDARADVFSLGCVLYKCLTGRTAFQGADGLAVLVKVLLEDPPRLRQLREGIPEALEDLIGRMLAKSPEPRPRDGAAVSAALAAVDLSAVDTRTQAPVAALRGLELTGDERRVMCLVLAREGASMQDVTCSEEELQQQAFSRMESLHALVDRYQGRLELIDARSPLIVLTSFGAPTDLAAQAARCALAVQTLLGGAPVALVTGRTEIAASLPIGDLIDRAAQLLAPGRATGVRIDEVTAGLLGGRFDIGDEPAGRCLHGAQDETRVRAQLLGKPMACVGRERELGVLTTELERCVEESTSTGVLVIAAAGVGKSRLRQELLNLLRARGDSIEVWLGQGDPMSAGSAFGLLARALRSAMGIVDGEPLEVRRQKVRARVERHCQRGDARRVAAFLGELVGAPFPDDDDVQLGAARRSALLMGDQLRQAFEDFVQAECAARPVMLILEDLHWGDLPTVTMVEAALRSAKDVPFLVLALGRPEVHTLFPRLSQGRIAHQIHLSPLTRRASERLVRQALGAGVSEALVAKLIERADGNPFFLEEQIRAMAAGNAEGLPETVLAMVQARLEALDTEARRVLRAASIFGQTFWLSGVSALVGGVQVTQRLRELEGREVVVRQAEGRLGGETKYRFRHALVREAAYGMLTEADRRLGHALAGDWLDRSGEGDAMSLAEHFERGGVPARAATAYLRAAQQALQGNDLGAATERAERGVACGAEPAVLGALRLVQAEAHVWRGELSLAEQRGTEAAARLEAGSAAWFSAVTQVVQAASKLGGFDRVERWTAAASGAAPLEGARGAKSKCLCAGASNLAFGGRFAVVDALIEAVERSATDAPELDADVAAILQQARAFRAMSRGDPGACVTGLEAALAAFERSGDRRNACITRANLGYSYGELGDFTGAEAALRSALSAADGMGLHEVAAAAQASLGQVLAYRGELAEARAIEEAAVASGQRLGDPRAEVVSRSYLAKIALLAGDLEGAEREARAAEALETESPLRLVATAVRARALLGLGRADEALIAAREAFSTLASLGALEEGESMIRLVHAEALAASGRRSEAAAAIASARDSLLARADRIHDPAWRERFLRSAPDSDRTLHLARQWLGESHP